MQHPAKTPPLSTQAGLLAVATLVSFFLFRGNAIPVPTPMIVISCIVLGLGWIALFMAWFTSPSKRT